MQTFLLTGIFALWASMFLVNDPHRRQMFDWFCAGALGVILPVEILLWLVRGTSGLGGFRGLYPASDSLGNFDNPLVIRPGAPDRLEKFHRQARGLVVNPAGRHPDFSHP